MRDISEPCRQMTLPSIRFAPSSLRLHGRQRFPTFIQNFKYPLYQFTVSSSKRSAAAPLYHAAFYGFHATGDCYVSPQGAASKAEKHFNSARFLYKTILTQLWQAYSQAAVCCMYLSHGHLGIFEWLLHCGRSDPNIGGCIGWSPLHSFVISTPIR